MNSPEYPYEGFGEHMGTLAIRQGDALYFARSLVWVITHMGKDVKDLDVMDRTERLHLLIEQRETLLGRKCTQAEVDTLAADCNVRSFQYEHENDAGGPIVGTWGGGGRRGRDHDGDA